MGASLEFAKLLWRCRRGMRELDVLLESYLRTRYATATMAEKQAFARLLELQDPAILRYLLAKDVPPDPVLARVVNEIRAQPEH